MTPAAAPRSRPPEKGLRCSRFEYQDRVGYGLHEHGFFGAFAKYGMMDAASGAA